MKNNNNICAPQTRLASSLYERWMKENFGSETDFYHFLTTPSMKRTAFLKECNVELSNEGIFVAQTYTI